jgi:hypothetical protein
LQQRPTFHEEPRRGIRAEIDLDAFKRYGSIVFRRRQPASYHSFSFFSIRVLSFLRFLGPILQFIAEERGPALALIGKNTGMLFDAMTIDEGMGGATWDSPDFPSRFRRRFVGY